MSEIPCAYRYTVKRGDSFYLIAHRTNVPLRELLAANPDIPPSRLTVGDVLCIPYGQEVQSPAADPESPAPQQPETPVEPPVPETPETPETDGSVSPDASDPLCPANRRAVVQEGQTAGDLQLRYGLSYHTLKSVNPDADLENLRGGDVLCIPENNVPCPLPRVIVLQAGETLESIAVTYNLPVASLLRANPCLAPEDFAEGVTVKLPN